MLYFRIAVSVKTQRQVETFSVFSIRFKWCGWRMLKFNDTSYKYYRRHNLITIRHIFNFGTWVTIETVGISSFLILFSKLFKKKTGIILFVFNYCKLYKLTCYLFKLFFFYFITIS